MQTASKTKYYIEELSQGHCKVVEDKFYLPPEMFRLELVPVPDSIQHLADQLTSSSYCVQANNIHTSCILPLFCLCVHHLHKQFLYI